MSEELKTAMNVVDQLQDWINRNAGGSCHPLPGLVYTTTTLEIFVGDFTVWTDQTNDADELTFEYCRDEFLGYVRSFGTLLKSETWIEETYEPA